MAYPAMGGAKNQLRACTAVANSALSANAARAKLDKPPLTAREFDRLLEDTLRDRTFPFCRMPEVQIDPYEIGKAAAATSTATGPSDSRLEGQMKQIKQQLSSITKASTAPGVPGKKKFGLADGRSPCNQFNQAKGCPRNGDPNSDGCTLENGTVLPHCCSFKMKNGLCAKFHPKHKH